MRKDRRMLALAVCLMLLLTLLASAAFAAREAGHACAGEGCGVCACLARTAELLRGRGMGGALPAAAAFSPLPVCSLRGDRAAFHPAPAPVGEKVRLND